MRDDYLKQISEAYVIDRQLPRSDVDKINKILVEARNEIRGYDDLYSYLCETHKYRLYRYLYGYLDSVIFEGFGAKHVVDIIDSIFGLFGMILPRAVLSVITKITRVISDVTTYLTNVLYSKSAAWRMYHSVVLDNAESCYKKCNLDSSDEVPKYLIGTVMFPKGITPYQPHSGTSSVAKILPCLVDCYCNIVLDNIYVLVYQLYKCLESRGITIDRKSPAGQPVLTSDDIINMVTYISKIPECTVYQNHLHNIMKNYLIFLDEFYAGETWKDITDAERQEIKNKKLKAISDLVAVVSKAREDAMKGKSDAGFIPPSSTMRRESR